MMLNNAEQALIDEFWATVGELEPFPRQLERPLLMALPVTLIKLPRLHLLEVERWLVSRGVAYRFNCSDRALRGCLLAFRGRGIIFVDGTDPDDERRFTLAHEIAHFLIDYWQPRQTVLERLGEPILPVLDGVRPPTVAERVHALLAKTPLGLHIDLLGRDSRIDDWGGAIWDIEDRADQMALALLAPSTAVLQASGKLDALSFEARTQAVTHTLTIRFGLPNLLAQKYAHQLLTARGLGRSWLESIGLR